MKGADTAKAAYTWAQRNGYPQLLISSFDHQQLFEYQKLDPVCPIAPLFHKWQKDVIEIGSELSAVTVNLSRRIATQKRVQKIRDAGFHVLVYTVNTRREARQLYNYGVSGVFTDYPDVVNAKSVLEP